MNKALLTGRLVQDPELRTTGNGTSVCTFRIAVNRRFPNQAGERVADFHTIVAWRQLGELCGKHLAKGRMVNVIGEIQNRSYEKDGSKRYITEIIADEVEFLTPKGNSSDAQQPTANYAPAAPASPAAPAAPVGVPAYNAAPAGVPPYNMAPGANTYNAGDPTFGSFAEIDDDSLPF